MCLWLKGVLCEQGACSSATEALMAQQDGCTYAGAAQLMQQVDTAEAELADTEKDAAVHPPAAHHAQGAVGVLCLHAALVHCCTRNVELAA